MTKTIEELEAEVVRTRAAAQFADATWRNAMADLQDARNEASGIVGHVLEFVEDYGKRQTVRIGVNDVKKGWRGETRAHGVRILKDGSMGTRKADCDVSKATDLGLYADVYPGRSP